MPPSVAERLPRCPAASPVLPLLVLLLLDATAAEDEATERTWSGREEDESTRREQH